MKLATCLALTFVLLSDARAQNASTGPLQLQNFFKQGDIFRYRLSFSHSGTDTDSSNGTHSGTLKHSFDFSREVQNSGLDNSATLKLTFQRCVFGNFDSSNAAQFQQVKTNPEYTSFGAILSCIGQAKVQPPGYVDSCNAISIDPAFDVQSVSPMLEEIGNYLLVPLPKKPVSVGDSWTGQIPVKMLGGPLSGNFLYIDGKYTVSSIESFKGEKCVRVKISLAKQPTLPIMPDSTVKNAETNFKAEISDGTLLFSLDKGNIVDYDVKVSTQLKITIDGQLLDNNLMKFEFDLKRLD